MHSCVNNRDAFKCRGGICRWLMDARPSAQESSGPPFYSMSGNSPNVSAGPLALTLNRSASGRPQQNHSDELHDGGDEMKKDGREERPELVPDREIQYLQDQGDRCEEGHRIEE